MDSHLLKCPRVSAEVTPEAGERQTASKSRKPAEKRSSIDITSSESGSSSKKQALMCPVVLQDKPLSAEEKAHFERLLVIALVSCNSALQTTDNPEFRELLHFLRPHAPVPSRRTLADRILSTEVGSQDLACNGKQVDELLAELQAEVPPWCCCLMLTKGARLTRQCWR